MFHNHLTLLGAHHAHIGKRQFLGLGHGKQKIWKENVILRKIKKNKNKEIIKIKK